MQWEMTQHDIRASDVRSIVLGEELGIRLHIVVEEKKESALRSGCTGIAGGRPAAVRLLQDLEREQEFQVPQGLSGTVARAVDDDNRLEVAKGLSLERRDVADNEFSALEGRDDNAEAHWQVSGQTGTRDEWICGTTSAKSAMGLGRSTMPPGSMSKNMATGSFPLV